MTFALAFHAGVSQGGTGRPGGWGGVICSGSGITRSSAQSNTIDGQPFALVYGTGFPVTLIFASEIRGTFVSQPSAPCRSQ